jgi:hypothetical protein
MTKFNLHYVKNWPPPLPAANANGDKVSLILHFHEEFEHEVPCTYFPFQGQTQTHIGLLLVSCSSLRNETIHYQEKFGHHF